MLTSFTLKTERNYLTGNMKIAILTSGILPVPAVRGGAVENLIDFYLEYNEQHRLHDITVYSVADPGIKSHPALQSEVNHYYYIDIDSPVGKIRKRIFHWKHNNEEYYHYSIEYFLFEAIKHIRHQTYDLIILENRPAYALKLKDISKARFVYHLHNEKLNNKTAHYQEIYDTASRIITVSDYIAKCVKTIQPHDTKCVTIYNGIDLHSFEGHDTRTGEKETFTLVFSGRINREKGIMELIEAMNFLKDYHAIHLLVIGSSFYGKADNENSFTKELKKKATNLKDRISFTGYIPYSQMSDYLALADVAVVPSVWDDPFPTTVIEAQAMGLPVITTRRGGIPEEVTSESAILLNTNEQFTEQLANTILDLYQNPQKRKTMSQAALQHAKYFSKQRYAEDFFKALE